MSTTSTRPWLTGYGMDEGRDEFDAWETWLEERNAPLVAALLDEGINLRVDLFAIMCDLCDLCDRQTAPTMERYVPHIYIDPPAADPWPEVPEKLYIRPNSKSSLRRTLNAIIACVDDLQRRLGKETE